MIDGISSVSAWYAEARSLFGRRKWTVGAIYSRITDSFTAVNLTDIPLEPKRSPKNAVPAMIP